MDFGKKLDQMLAVVAPTWAANRINARQLINAYEAAEKSRLRRNERSIGSADRQLMDAGNVLVERARHLDENHDIVTGLLTTLVNSTIGKNGISIEPMPRLTDGSLAEEFARQISDFDREWSKCVDTTGEYDRPAAERMLALSFFRDGEAFQRHLVGHIPGYQHNNRVPYSIELIDWDWLDWNYNDSHLNIVQSVEKNNWGRPTGYWFFKQNRGDAHDFKFRHERHRIDAAWIDHIKLVRRINQTRGVSVLASSMNRISDLKDYEESERVAARIAAAMVAYVKKGSSENYRGTSSQTHRQFDIAPGMVFDNLYLGEEINTIDHKRPSQLLQSFRDSMVRAISAGTGAAFSSTARVYDKGSYSSQRQEMIEAFIAYSVYTAVFISKITRSSYQKRIRCAIAANQLIPPANIDWQSVDDAEYRGPVMPWIDPVQEANGHLIQVQAGFKSISQVIRERGQNPRDVFNQIVAERNWYREFGVQLPNIAPFDALVPTEAEEPLSGTPEETETEEQNVRLVR